MGSLPLTNLFSAAYKQKRRKGGRGVPTCRSEPGRAHSTSLATRSLSPSAQDRSASSNIGPACDTLPAPSVKIISPGRASSTNRSTASAIDAAYIHPPATLLPNRRHQRLAASPPQSAPHWPHRYPAPARRPHPQTPPQTPPSNPESAYTDAAETAQHPPIPALPRRLQRSPNLRRMMPIIIHHGHAALHTLAPETADQPRETSPAPQQSAPEPTPSCTPIATAAVAFSTLCRPGTCSSKRPQHQPACSSPQTAHGNPSVASAASRSRKSASAYSPYV